MKQLLIEPIGVAIHTRKEEQGSNYDWCVQAGTLQLFELADKVYATVLRGEEIGNLESTKFAIIRKNKRLGLLIANMPTTRSHFAGGAISTTLYLEFNAPEQSVLDAIATLLSPIEHSQLQLFCNYAEEIFNSKDATIIPAIQFYPVHIPDEPIVKKTGCVFSSNGSRERYVSFVANLPNNFCFISTGYVKLHQYQEIKDILQCKTLLLTTGEVVTPPTCLTWLNLFFILMFTTATVVVYEYVRIELQKQSLVEKQKQQDRILSEISRLKIEESLLQTKLGICKSEASRKETQIDQLERGTRKLEKEIQRLKRLPQSKPTSDNTRETVPKSEEQKQFETWLSLKAVDNDEKLTDKTIGDALRESRKSFKQWLDKKPKQPTTKQPIKDWFNNLPQPAYFFLEHYCIEFTLRYQQMSIPPGVENYCEEYVEYEKKKPPQNETVTVKCSYYFDIHTQNWKLFPDNTQECFNDN